MAQIRTDPRTRRNELTWVFEAFDLLAAGIKGNSVKLLGDGTLEGGAR